jgi:hypothetical protein
MEHHPTSLMGVAVPIALSGGAWWFLGFLIVAFFGIVFGYYTRKGSGINQRPYGNVYSADTAAKNSPSEISGRDKGAPEARNWSRGTR